MIQARSGDQDAFDRLVELYQRRAVSVSYRLLGSIHDAADVSQDAFLRAYRNLNKLDDPSRFGAWLMRIVVNLSLNLRRSRSRRLSLSTEDLVEDGKAKLASGARTGTNDSPSASAETDEMKETIAQAIDSLPEKQRTALVLFSIEGVPQKEVAHIMNCSVQLVKWNVFQARKALRKKLKDYLD